MNERLEALIKQCTVDEVDYLAPWFDKELFARLILEEAFQHLTNMGHDFSREILEKHFGVEL